MATTNIAITGVPTTPGPDGAIPLRRELRDLQRNFPDQFNLYVLGLRHLQGLDQAQLQSYYQIAGIHGLPFKPWNGVNSTSNWRQSRRPFGGYCTHSSVLFIPWHRPYLALYEQALYRSVQEVASQFPSGAVRDRYTAAAATFRAPYLDWASQPPTGSSAWPSALSGANIQVVDVDGRTKSIPNPINRYTFHPINPSPGDFNARWSPFPNTVRYPNAITGQSQDNRIAPILTNELASLRTNVSLLLLSYRNFDAFSFNQWDPNTRPGAFGSLEDIHNEIHDRVGGGGHMSSLEVSSYDPFFWLHHTNVDRLWAIWQDLNPAAFLSPRPAPSSTFSTQAGALETRESPLAPFWDKSGTKFWTPDQVRGSAVLGYAYPETQRWRYASTAAYQTALRQTVTRLYGSNVFANFVANVADRQPPATSIAARTAAAVSSAAKPVVAAVAQTLVSRPAPAPAGEGQAPMARALAGEAQKVVGPPPPPAEEKKKEAEAPAAHEGPIPASFQHLAPDNKYTEWVVNIRAQKHGLGQSFRVQVFLGDIDDETPESWDTEWNSVGRVSVLGRAPETECGKCQADTASNLIVSGTVPLTSALLQDIVADELASLDPADVVPHLARHLQWKVTLFTGEAQPVESVPDLKVSVASTVVTIGEDGLPVYSGEYTVHPEATEGKPAGLNAGEHI